MMDLRKMNNFQNLGAIPRDDPRRLAGMCVLCKSYDFDNAANTENCLGCSRYHPDLFERVVDHREWNVSTGERK